MGDDGYTVMLLREDGRPPRTLQVSARSVLSVLGIGAAIAVLCLLAGWHLGVLTAAL